MKTITSMLLLFLGLCLSALAGAQASAKLLVTTDMDCTWKLDGVPMGLLKAEDSKVVPVSPRVHFIEAETTDGVTSIHTKVEADPGQTPVKIQLESQHEQQQKVKRDKTAGESEKADAVLNSTWTDPETSLMWDRKDNGADMNWYQANYYCSNLQLAGYSNWRLPTIEELKGIYDPNVSLQAMWDAGIVHLHVKGNLKLTGWLWSSSQGDPSQGAPLGFAMIYTFAHKEHNGGFPYHFNYNTRALCVRGSGK